ncbi:5'-nucleotidase [Hyalangium rubrum]|uniref:5'-nucleotidase n=1 Tax=Hyalangium rubrum TaxID=3103134 RepID=A0ABU5H4B5_9BACT|nr:5'-nucleotidase [Hyalangium sp. s54d21]MDY7228317.1 5'-nucleotidase [Hyalangium sp. s54d21]
MIRPLLAALLAAALVPGLGCLAYNDPCQPLVANPDAVIGILGENVYLDRPFARHDNNALGQMAADAYQHAEDDSGDLAGRAELGIINGGSIRAEGLCINRTVLPSGPLTDGVFHEVLLFENRLVTVNLTEQQLVDMMEHSVGSLFPEGQPIGTPFGGFLHVSESTTVRVDCGRPRGQRVLAMQVGNRAVQLPPRANVFYRVAMADFLLQGGDGYGPIFAGAGQDPARNPVQSRKLGGVDSNIASAYMKSVYSSDARPLREASRIVFENCARPSRPTR